MADPTPIVAVYLRPEEITTLESLLVVLQKNNEENQHTKNIEEIVRRAHAGQGIKKTK